MSHVSLKTLSTYCVIDAMQLAAQRFTVLILRSKVKAVNRKESM